MEFQSGAIDPVSSIKEGWEVIKGDYWTFFGMSLVAFIIIFASAMILGFVNNLITFAVSSILGVAANGGGEAARISTSLVPQLLSMFISLFTNILVGAVSGVLFVGIYKALSRKTTEGTADFGDLFSGLQKFTACLIVAAAVALAQFVLSVVLLFIGAAVGLSTFGLGMITAEGKLNPAVFGSLFLMILLIGLVYLVVNLIISVLTTFAYPLIADRDLTGGEALGLSVRSGLANLGGLTLLLILLVLMSFVGVLACLIGVLFVAPVIVAAIFVAYQKVFGRARDSFIHTPPPPPTFGNQPGY